MIDNLSEEIMRSWCETNQSLNTDEDIFLWIKERNENTHVEISECSIYKSDFWFYDDYKGEVLNRKRSFFSIIGMRHFEDGRFIGEQPIIIQPEIGYLGIICKIINGILHFLMQAKIEPGNVNCVQVSPTIQATKSNFMRVHGGNLPAYFEYFENSSKYTVIYDQVQSEQASRFYKKRNRNMVMLVDEDIPIQKNFMWMTLRQIKKLLKMDNLVNMDTRTVLSGLPLCGELKNNFCMDHIGDKFLLASIFSKDPHEELPTLFQRLNNYKMFRDVKSVAVPLNELVEWDIDEFGIRCKNASDFSVKYYNIYIAGREVQNWTQPLFEATGMAVFGLLTRVYQGTRQFLVHIMPEIGSFDKIEFGPSIQWEPSHSPSVDNTIDRVFRKLIDSRVDLMVDVILSEEGGRFYHEQNRNIIVDISDNEIEIPEEYIWTNYSTLNYLVQMNDCLNIQLRNLLSLIDI